MKIIYKILLVVFALIAIFSVNLIATMNKVGEENSILVDTFSVNLTSINNIRTAWDSFRSAREFSDSILEMNTLVEREFVQETFNQ